MYKWKVTFSDGTTHIAVTLFNGEKGKKSVIKQVKDWATRAGVSAHVVDIQPIGG